MNVEIAKNGNVGTVGIIVGIIIGTIIRPRRHLVIAAMIIHRLIIAATIIRPRHIAEVIIIHRPRADNFLMKIKIPSLRRGDFSKTKGW